MKQNIQYYIKNYMRTVEGWHLIISADIMQKGKKGITKADYIINGGERNSDDRLILSQDGIKLKIDGPLEKKGKISYFSFGHYSFHRKDVSPKRKAPEEYYEDIGRVEAKKLSGLAQEIFDKYKLLLSLEPKKKETVKEKIRQRRSSLEKTLGMF